MQLEAVWSADSASWSARNAADLVWQLRLWTSSWSRISFIQITMSAWISHLKLKGFQWKLFDLPTIVQKRGVDLARLKRSFIQSCFMSSWITMSAWILRNWTQFDFQTCLACLQKNLQLQTSGSCAYASSLIVLCNQFVAMLTFSLFSHILETKWQYQNKITERQLTTSNQIFMVFLLFSFFTTPSVWLV